MHETIEALSAYVDNEVSAGERARIEAHLASCTDCTSRKALLEGASASLRTLPPVSPTAAESRRIRQGVLGRTRRRSLFPGRLRPVWAGAGAGALALVVAGVVAGAGMLRNQPSHDNTTAGRSSSAPQAAPVFESPEDVRSFVSSDSGVKRALGAISPSAASGSKGAEAPLGATVPGAAQDRTRSLKGAPPAPPKTTAGPGRRELAEPAPERSAGDCQAEVQHDQASDLRPLLTRAATYRGTPAWLLVYAAPAPSPGGAERLVVYLVGRADCGLLTYQLVPAP